MSTKFILVGGYLHKAADSGQAFCQELVKGLKEPVKILVCMFARPEESWAVALTKDKKFFADHLPGKKLEIKLADPEKFIEQVKWAEVIFLRGGDAEPLLVNLLSENSHWLNHLDGKTVAGTSAGADALAKYYYSLDHNKIEEGIGLLDIKVIPHYFSDYNAPNIDWAKAYQTLDEYEENFPMIALREGEFKVLEKQL